jgi:hypothetical protein
MGVPLARSKMRTRVAVLGAAALILTALVMSRSVSVQAHEVTTPYPLTCSMVGLNPTFTTNHDPMDGTTPGGTVVLHVHLATPATGMAMTTKVIDFSLPKPALIERIVGVTFKPGGNFSGMASVDASGTAAIMFMGNAMSNAIVLPDFDITAVTKTSATVGDKVSWIGPSKVLLDNGATDTCTPAGGTAIQYAPTAVIAAGCPTGPATTADAEHGDHDHGGATPACTTTTSRPVVTTRPPVVTTRPPVVTTRPPVVTTRPPVVTTRPPVVTTRPPVVTTRPTPPTTSMRPGLLGLFMRLLCQVFHIFC